MRILLAAEESAGVRTLQAVRKSGHELTGVLTSSPQSAVGKEATRHGVPVWPAARLKDAAFVEEARQMQAAVLLNVHSLYLVPAAVLGCFPEGAFNLHPGPLPDYAGMNAPAWAILNGEPRHGVTLHWMTAGVDEGFIAYQELFDLQPADTGLSVSMKCITLGLSMIDQLLATLAAGSPVPRTPQDLSRRRYFGRQIPHGGQVPAGLTAAALQRWVRASDFAPFPSPWGSPTLPIGGEPTGLLRIALTGVARDADEGSVRKQENGQYWLAAADEWVVLQRITRGGRAGEASTLLAGEAG